MNNCSFQRKTADCPDFICIFQRAKSANMDKLYLTFFQLPSHAVHGNWQDLVSNHLECEDDGFIPNTKWNRPRPQLILPNAIISAEINKIYLDNILYEEQAKEKIDKIIDNILFRTYQLDKLHEQFLQR